MLTAYVIGLGGLALLYLACRYWRAWTVAQRVEEARQARGEQAWREGRWDA